MMLLSDFAEGIFLDGYRIVEKVCCQIQQKMLLMEVVEQEQ